MAPTSMSGEMAVMAATLVIAHPITLSTIPANIEILGGTFRLNG